MAHRAPRTARLAGSEGTETVLNVDFLKIAPYLKDPLVLVGFFLFLSFLFVRGIIKAGIIPQLSAKYGYQVLQRILLYGFIVAIVLMALGFFLKYRELSDREQASVVRMLDQEFRDNLKVMEELKLNTRTIIAASSAISSVLRTSGIPILAELFPKENLENGAANTISADYAHQLLVRAQDAGLLRDELERKKFAAAARVTSDTIGRTIATIQSLSDSAGRRYALKSDVWTTQLPILRQITVLDITRFQASYAALQMVRANYDVVVSRCIDYLTAVQEFLSPSDGVIDSTRLAKVLASERLYMSLVSTYGDQLVANLEEISALEAVVHELLSQ